MFRRIIFVAVAAAGMVAAQDPPTRVGRLNHVEGSVSFQPGGVNDWVPATINRPLTAGDQVYADAGARAEIQVPGAAFRLSSQTAFEFMNLDDRNVQVRLSEGTLNIHALSLDANLEVDTPNLAFQIVRPGVYRIDTNPNTNETYVTVRTGEGQVTSNSGAFAVHAREQAIINGQDQQAQYNVYQAPALDEFDSWAASRDRSVVRGQSSRYVSSSMVGYQDLDQYGTWQQVPEYGRCWVPRNVSADWSPYHNGHWAWIDPWGWSWVDDEPWGFAPYHYGRWAHFGNTWGWVPGPVASRPVYAPALVAWVGFGGGGRSGVSLGFGGGSPSVGWFPLGPRDVYIPSYNASRGYVSRVNVTNTTVINNTNVTNVYNNYVQNRLVPMASYANRAVPGAVVAVPQNAFASARPVQQVAMRMQPNQMTAMRTIGSAPGVSPQVASVLGRPGPAPASTPRPAAAVMSRPVVARTAAPPPRPLFQQQQSQLARTPGRPLPIQQQQQIARSAPAPAIARPPVQVVTQARPVAPRVINTPPPPRPAPTATAQRPNAPMAQPVPPQVQPAQPQRGVPAQAQPVRPYAPPSAQQQQAQPLQPNRPAPVPPPQNRPFAPPPVQQRQAQPVQPAPVPQQQPRVQPPAQNRPFEPPAVQQRQSPSQPNRVAPVPQQQPRVQPPPQPNRPAPVPQQQPRVQPPPQNRPFEPPAVQQRQVPPPQPNRPAAVPQQQPRVEPPNRPYTPPVQQRQAPVQPARPSEPPRQQAQPRPVNPPPQAQRDPAQERNRSVAPPPRQQSQAPPAQQRQAAAPPPPQKRQAAPPPAQRKEPPPEERKKQDRP